MSNIAVIFAGGVGQRMNVKSMPKQFLEVDNKPIIIHTLEIFDNHEEVDSIIISCVKEWMEYMNECIKKFNIRKVKNVVAGGDTGQMSIYNGLVEAEKCYENDSIVLIHDGVRPLIDADTITENIKCVKKNGNAITSSTAIETFVVTNEEGTIEFIPDRERSKLAKAPQSFILKDILNAHRQAQNDNVFSSIDSCTLMTEYGYNLSLVEGPINNIKITTPIDFFVFKSIYNARKKDLVKDM